METSIWGDIRLMDHRIAVELEALQADMDRVQALIHQRMALVEELAKRWRASRDVPMLHTPRYQP